MNFPRHKVAYKTIYGQVITAIQGVPQPSGTFPIYQDHGSDYIERNAMVLVKLIQQINAQLPAGSTEQLTIVGPSMGGLISRYALAYMEKNGMNHNTKLWISLDSPHNGANISIGLQDFLHFFGVTLNDDETKKALREQLDSPAARQQLLDHYKSIVSNNHVAAPDFYRNIFVNNLTTNGLPNSGGFPTQLRKVAIANGSQNGILSGYAGQHVFQVRGYVYNGFFNVNFLQVAEGNIRLGGSYGTVANSFNGYKHSRSDHLNSTINNSTSLDFSPGGTYEMFGEVAGQTPTGNSIIKPAILGVPFGYLLGFASRIEADCYKAEGCFIPTKSALAYKGANLDWGQGVSDRSLVCMGETPFDAYYAPNGANEGHIKLNNGNVTWVMRELDGIKNTNPAPYPMNFQVAIIADPNNSNCINTPQRYSIDPNSLPVPAADIISVNWIPDANLTIVPSGNSVTATTYGNGIGRVRVEVIVRSICLNKGIGAVDLGPAPNYNINFTELSGNTLCKGNTLRYTLMIKGQLAATMVGTPQYTVSSNLQIINPNPNSLEVLILEAGAGSISVVINHTDPCRGSYQGMGTLYLEASAPPMVGKFAFPNVVYDACFGTTYPLIISPDFNATDVSINGAPFVPITGPIELTAGTYTITLSNSCGASRKRTMTISAAPLGCKTVAETPKKSDVLPEITVSPNPANTYLDVTNILAGSEVKIYTKMGILVHSEKSENDKIRLDISKLNTDLYILEAVLPNNVRVRKQIVKQ